MFSAAVFTAVVLVGGRADEIMTRVDRLRLAGDAMLVRTEISLFEADTMKHQKAYDVYLAPGRRSLVVFRAPAEIGQKVLMIDDDFWLLLPSSRRPIRITPAQRLLGEASTGDIATMHWSSDYTSRVVAEDVALDSQPCTQLELIAARRGTSYRRIELWVNRETWAPYRAKLYLSSGKLAKEAEFAMGTLAGRTQVTQMVLVDHIERHRKTVIRYLSMEPRSIPDKLFNPAYLARDADLPL